jgi:hypothetical protein
MLTKMEQICTRERNPKHLEKDGQFGGGDRLLFEHGESSRYEGVAPVRDD